MSDMTDGTNAEREPANNTTETVYVGVDKLSIHPQNRDIYGEEDVSGLVAEMDGEGFDESNPLTVNAKDEVVKGNRRLRAARMADIQRVPVLAKSYDSEQAELRNLVMDNVRQRERTPPQKYREAQLLEEVESESAKDRQGTRTDLTQNFAEGETGETRKKVAETVGIGSKESCRKLGKVMEAADDGEPIAEQQVEQLSIGEQSIHGAHTALKESREANGSDTETAESDAESVNAGSDGKDIITTETEPASTTPDTIDFETGPDPDTVDESDADSEPREATETEDTEPGDTRLRELKGSLDEVVDLARHVDPDEARQVIDRKLSQLDMYESAQPAD